MGLEKGEATGAPGFQNKMQESHCIRQSKDNKGRIPGHSHASGKIFWQERAKKKPESSKQCLEFVEIHTKTKNSITKTGNYLFRYKVGPARAEHSGAHQV
eukprot:767321-Hanusia_phi.AAC.5